MQLYNLQARSPQLFLFSVPVLEFWVSLTQKWGRHQHKASSPQPACGSQLGLRLSLVGDLCRGGAQGCQLSSRHDVSGKVGAGPARWVLSASSSDIYRGRAVYTLPVPHSICLPTCLNTEGAKCLPCSSCSHRLPITEGSDRHTAPLRS